MSQACPLTVQGMALASIAARGPIVRRALLKEALMLLDDKEEDFRTLNAAADNLLDNGILRRCSFPQEGFLKITEAGLSSLEASRQRVYRIIYSQLQVLERKGCPHEQSSGVGTQR